MIELTVLRHREEKVKTFIWPNEATLDYSKSKCPLAIWCLMFVFLCFLSYLGTLWIS